uniref:Protein SPT2 homolog n=1 Tax=Romanomermis culicivorax TaxID=13658 RepID=A0A915L4R8_ROMCU
LLAVLHLYQIQQIVIVCRKLWHESWRRSRSIGVDAFDGRTDYLKLQLRTKVKMSLSFGKLMQAADRNSQDLSKKINQRNIKNGQPIGLRGPDPSAVRAFLEKKKTEEQRRLDAKRNEDMKRLEENRAKEAKLKRTGSKIEFYKQMLQKSPSKKHASGDYNDDETPQRLREERKNDAALNNARLKLSKHNSIDGKNDKRLVPISNGGILDRRKEELRDKKTDNVRKTPSKSAAASSIKSLPPVDFAKLMQVAVKNREEKVHLDDDVAALKKKAEENLRALNLKPKPAPVIKPKNDKIASPQVKTKPVSTPVTNKHELKSKSLITNLPALSLSKNPTVKPVPVVVKPEKNVAKNGLVPKSTSNKPLPSKLDSLKSEIVVSNFSKPIKRPGTPPKTTPVVKKSKLPPPAILRKLPSTSGQTFAKKADLERALARRREMQEIRKMFKYNPKKYKHLDDMDDKVMESSYRDIQKEEARSARLGLMEDLEDIQREQEEMKKKMKSSR